MKIVLSIAFLLTSSAFCQNKTTYVGTITVNNRSVRVPSLAKLADPCPNFKGYVSKAKTFAEIDLLGIHATQQDLENAHKTFKPVGVTPEQKKYVDAHLEIFRSTAEVLILNQRIDEILSKDDDRFKNDLKVFQATANHAIKTEEFEYLQLRRYQFWYDPKLNGGLQVLVNGKEVTDTAKMCGL
jgi:hypothetical protein